MGGAFSRRGNSNALPTRTLQIPEFRLKAILVGSPFSGRSSIFERYINNLFNYESRGSPHTLRMGSKVWLVSEPTGGVVYVNLWDTPRYAATETGGPTLWAGAGVIFVCVDGKDCKDIEAEVSKWCQDPVIVRAHNVYGTIICVLITKADALQTHQEERIKTTMRQMLQMPDFALDTWSLCSAKTSRGLQGPDDIIKILFHQYVKDEGKRQRKNASRNRRSVMGIIGEDTNSRPASAIGLACNGLQASFVEAAAARKAPRRSMGGTPGQCSIAAADKSHETSSKSSVIPMQYLASVINDSRADRAASRQSEDPGAPFCSATLDQVFCGTPVETCVVPSHDAPTISVVHRLSRESATTQNQPGSAPDDTLIRISRDYLKAPPPMTNCSSGVDPSPYGVPVTGADTPVQSRS